MPLENRGWFDKERRVPQVLDETQMRVLTGYQPTSFGQRPVHLAELSAPTFCTLRSDFS